MQLNVSITFHWITLTTGNWEYPTALYPIFTFLHFFIFLRFVIWVCFSLPSNANANDGTKIELNRLKTTIMKVLIATFQIIWFLLLYFAVQILFLVHISVGLFAKKNVWKMYEKLQLSFDIFIIIPQLIIFFGCFLLLSIDVNALL